MPQNEDPLDEVYRELMKLAGEEGCLCGIEGCPGHEVIDGCTVPRWRASTQ
jgi:hypothetical protein